MTDQMRVGRLGIVKLPIDRSADLCHGERGEMKIIRTMALRRSVKQELQ